MIVTQSAKIRSLIELARRVGPSTASVLLTGESGTGKELFAQLVHDASARCHGPLVRVNCAALPANLIESELFGHERGSFTDAVAARKGRFEMAAGGSLLLDEIGEVPVSTQAKLLRVLESNEFERVGSSQPIQHDARVIAATNLNLLDRVREKEFRLDLYHRINVIQIQIPALRERLEDVPILAMHFVERFRGENAKYISGFTSKAMKLLSQHDWPGNVRELRNVVHRACILSESDLIGESVLDLCSGGQLEETPSPDSRLPERWLQTELAEVEREIIVAAIDRYGNRRIVAEKLGVSPRTLTNKIKQYRQDEKLPRAA